MEWFLAVLRFTFTAIYFVGAFVLPLVLFYGVWSFYQRPTQAIRWLIWVFLIEAIIIVQPSLPLGVNLFIPDLLFLLIGAAGLLRLFVTSLRWPHYLWLIFGAMLALSFALGVLKFGSKSGVELRPYFYFWAGIWYLMTFRLSSADLEKIARSWMFASAVMVVIACFRWMALAAGLEITHYWNEGGQSLRVFTSTQTFFLVQGFIIGLYARLNKIGPAWWSGLVPILLICIVVLQHRTLWVMAFVSTAVLVLAAGKVRSRALTGALAAAVIGAVVLTPLLLGGKLDRLQQSLSHSVEEVGQKNSTLAWRVQGWQALVQQWASASPFVNLAGFPFGSGFNRRIEASQTELTQSPHSQYVTMLLRTGLVGLLAMLAAYALAIRGMWRWPHSGAPQILDNKVLLALLLGQVFFFITYAAEYNMILPLGLALTQLSAQRATPLVGSPGLARAYNNWGAQA